MTSWIPDDGRSGRDNEALTALERLAVDGTYFGARI